MLLRRVWNSLRLGNYFSQNEEDLENEGALVSPAEELSDDICNLIWRRLSPRDCAMAAAVCRTWRNSLDDGRLWRDFLMEECGDTWPVALFAETYLREGPMLQSVVSDMQPLLPFQKIYSQRAQLQGSIILDGGSGYCKYGRSENLKPTDRSATFLEFANIESPIYSRLKYFFSTIFSRLQVKPSAQPLVLSMPICHCDDTESAKAARWQLRESIHNILFDMNVPAVCAIDQAVLALYAAQQTSGIVVNIGFQITSIVPILRGKVMRNVGVELVGQGALRLTGYLSELMRSNGIGFDNMSTVRTLKENLCYVAAEGRGVDRMLFSNTMANDGAAAGLIAFFIMVLCVTVEGQAGRASRFPAVLVFGDSTLDPGNNNNINTPAKANFPPYGRDFPGRVATGRFANGKLTSDYIASALGIKETIPAYLQPGLTSDDLLTGVSFASSGSGYDNFTSASGNTITFAQQVQYLREYKSRISQIAGAEEGSRIIAESLYYIASGSADWGVGYFYNTGNMGNTRARNFTVSQYQDFLIRLALGYFRDMYDIGARKFLVAGLSILGCSPGERTFLALAGRPCNIRINDASAGFNRKWAPALSNLQASLSGTTFVYSDIYDIAVDTITNPLRYGFLVTTRGCCGTGLAETGRDCARAAALSCPDASRFVWWDSVHPSSATYQIIANLVMRRDVPRFP